MPERARPYLTAFLIISVLLCAGILGWWGSKMGWGQQEPHRLWQVHWPEGPGVTIEADDFQTHGAWVRMYLDGDLIGIMSAHSIVSIKRLDDSGQ